MSRYLGNKNKKEFHDLNRQTSQCQTAEIKDRVYFSSTQEAEAAGYDRCHYCLGRSQR